MVGVGICGVKTTGAERRLASVFQHLREFHARIAMASAPEKTALAPGLDRACDASPAQVVAINNNRVLTAHTNHVSSNL
jgi:hypothetical protein